MDKLLVHIITGVENPSRSVLGFLVAKSAQARGITKEQLESLGFTPATPNKLVELTFEADRVLIY